MYENGTMRSVETILKGEEIKERDGGDESKIYCTPSTIIIC
jgi:hypothetical protein